MRSRLSSLAAWILAGLAVAVPSARGREDAPARDTSLPLKFLQGLRDRGYHDLALDYLDKLRQDPETPPELKTVLDYEEGRGTLEESSRLSDLEKRHELQEKARVKLDAFVKASPNHPLATEALVQSARLLFERAQTAVLQANELKAENDKKTKLAEARASFVEARNAYGRAVGPLKAKYDAFPKYIPDDDPRRGEKQQAHIALMNAELQKALVDYEEAQTYTLGSKERNDLLDAGMTSFENIYKRYRTWLAGLFARLWQAKCYEEQGKLTEAMGIYKELMEHQDQALIPLQRKVQYFQIIVDGKRGEHALAVDRAANWLKNFPNALRSDEGVGVKLELAKNILAQLDTLNETDRQAAINRSADLLTEVVRYYSPFKPEAVALLQKYKPKAALTANNVATLSYDDAYAQGEGALSTHEWDRAIALFKHAVRKADPNKDIEKANRARYMIAYASYEGQRFYQAAVVGEHIARNYPKWGLAPKAAEIALGAHTLAYNTYFQVDRGADLPHLVDLSKYIAETWPETDQADAARLTLGEIALNRVTARGKVDYVAAYTAFESIRPDSPKRLDAQVKAADARWRQSAVLRDENKTAEADAEVKKAFELLEGALKARSDAKVPPTDPAYITNANALGELRRANGQAKEALALLEPIAKTLAAAPVSAELAPLYTNMLTILLRAHIANGQADAAIADMKALESSGGSKESLTQLYFELGRTLKKELEELEAKKYTTKLNQTRAAYSQFLQALANSKAGQTYDSLMFAGESLLSLGQAKEASAVFDRVLTAYEKDDAFRKSAAGAGGGDRLLRTKLRKAEALRKEGKFAESQKANDEVRQLGPKLLEPLLEQGYLYEDWASREPTMWRESYNHWRRLSAQLERTRPRRIEYYEALLHVAKALEGQGKKAEAAQTLKSVMTLSPAVGNPEMKAKFQAMLTHLTAK